MVSASLLLVASPAVSRAGEKAGFFYSDYLSHVGISASSLEVEPFSLSSTDDIALSSHASINDIPHASRNLEATPLQGWFADGIIGGDSSGQGWSSNPGLVWLDFASAEVARELEHTMTDSFGFVRRSQVDVQLPLGDRPGSTGISFTGAFFDNTRNMLGWQLRGHAGQKAFGSGSSPKSHKGGSFGFIYRSASVGRGAFSVGHDGQGLWGLNSFIDYENRYKEEFARWSAGAEARTPWVSFYGNIYRAITSPKFGLRIDTGRDSYSEETLFTPDGFDVEVNLHAPGHEWVSVLGEYYSWDDYKDAGGEKGWRAGFRFQTLSFPLVFDVLHENGDAGRDWGGRIAVNIDFGEQRPAFQVREAFAASDYLYDPANREYSQRVFDVTVFNLR